MHENPCQITAHLKTIEPYYIQLYKNKLTAILSFGFESNETREQRS